jgi:hypothetical protein
MLYQVQSGPMRRVSVGTSVRGPGSKAGAYESLNGPIALSHRCFLLIFLNSEFWKLMTGKFTGGFIGSQTLNFERSLSLSPGPQNSLDPPCKISFGGPEYT